MTNEYQIRVTPEVAAQEDRLKGWLAGEQGIDERTIYGVRILKRSIDARQRQIFINLKIRVYVVCCAETDRVRVAAYRAGERKRCS